MLSTISAQQADSWSTVLLSIEGDILDCELCYFILGIVAKEDNCKLWYTIDENRVSKLRQQLIMISPLCKQFCSLFMNVKKSHETDGISY